MKLYLVEGRTSRCKQGREMIVVYVVAVAEARKDVRMICIDAADGEFGSCHWEMQRRVS